MDKLDRSVCCLLFGFFFFNQSKKAVLEARTGHFVGLVGFEAKAKCLSFEIKAKDFKLCPRGRPRGHGRPRGLHLWFKWFGHASRMLEERLPKQALLGKANRKRPVGRPRTRWTNYIEALG